MSSPLPATSNEKALFINICGGVLFLILVAITKPDITAQRFIALCIAIVDAFLLFYRGGFTAPFGILLIPLGLIWLADSLSILRGNVGRGGVIDTDTPDWMITGFGWIVLLLFSGYVLHD